MLRLLFARLDLFDGEGGSAPSGDSSGTSASPTGDLSSVQYGKDTSPEPTETEPQETAEPAPKEKTLEERTKEYQEFIKANKDIHDAENQKIFNKRFKDYKELQTANARQAEILQRLSDRYKTNAGDLDALSKALDSDDRMWEDAADEAGMSVEQYKEFQKLTRENQRLVQTQKEAERQQKADEQVSKWLGEEQTLKQQFPDFSLNTELDNPQFAHLLQAGIPMEHAYKVTHFDELQQNAAVSVAKATEKKVTDSIRAKGNRPTENGTRTTSAFTRKTDVSQLTKADRAEIARRVARGEQISF